MNDENLLKRALEQYGCSFEKDEKTLNVEDFKIGFLKNDVGIFEAVFDIDIKFEDAQRFLQNIEEEYTHILQQETYQKLLHRAKEQGLILETEEVNESNSIILTFKV
ncbi:DUF1257 domain-containing protein [Cytobacillus sp. FJAT-54145]|uniref:DUF1257 domain-containing protein n=1 Tax=Cytobacillus spartinae TaxID=3299023 RepID=A0ABW6K8R2_9BACI